MECDLYSDRLAKRVAASGKPYAVLLLSGRGDSVMRNAQLQRHAISCSSFSVSTGFTLVVSANAMFTDFGSSGCFI